MKPSIGRPSIYIVIICVLLLLLNVTLGVILTIQSNAAMRELLESRMLDISNTAAAMIDGNVVARLQAEDKGSPEYNRILGTLTSFYDNIELEYIYLLRDTGDGNYVFLIDSDRDSPGQFGDPVETTEALRLAGLGKASVDKEPYQDKWGRFISAYSPVFNGYHQVTGVVAVDFSAEKYESEVFDQVKTTVLVSAASVLICLAAILIIALRFKKRFEEMASEMNVVSEGIEKLVSEISPNPDRPEKTLEEEVREGSGDVMSRLSDRIRLLKGQLGERIDYVRSLAYVDGLTKLGNRLAYEDLVMEIDACMNEGQVGLKFAVAEFDLDGLKIINDTKGHPEGDRAIQAAASALQQTFEDAQLFRIGGDEFIVILDDPQPDLETKMDRVNEILAESGSVRVSKGFAVYDPAVDESYREVYKRADDLMYQEKKNCLVARKKAGQED